MWWVDHAVDGQAVGGQAVARQAVGGQGGQAVVATRVAILDPLQAVCARSRSRPARLRPAPRSLCRRGTSNWPPRRRDENGADAVFRKSPLATFHAGKPTPGGLARTLLMGVPITAAETPTGVVARTKVIGRLHRFAGEPTSVAARVRLSWALPSTCDGNQHRCLPRTHLMGVPIALRGKPTPAALRATLSWAFPSLCGEVASAGRRGAARE